MRNLFLTRIMDLSHPANLTDAAAVVGGLPSQPLIPSEDLIRAFPDSKLAPLLPGIRNTTVGGVRNSVVHKMAYRPSRDEAFIYLEEAEELLSPMSYLLDVHDDINWYGRKT